MLSRRNRFHGISALNRVYKKSQSVRGPLISLKYAKRINNRPYRVAVVVGKKVHKSAVKRNRIRRRIFEAVRTSELIPPSTDLIFLVYNDQVADMEYEQLRTQIDGLLSKLNKH